MQQIMILIKIRQSYLFLIIEKKVNFYYPKNFVFWKKKK